MLFNLINNIRLICIKSIQKANSGHPGMPLGVSDFFVILWNYYYKNNLNNTNSINKDKLIISNGHGVIIQYVLLYLSKIYNINEIKNLRKFGSKTPAHPEISKFVDASTGPLGQGVGIGIGVGLRSKILSKKFNTKINLFNNKIWIICGDGCLMEGISNEVISFSGNLFINNLILIYDSNNISIDGNTHNYFKENIKQKFFSMNWDVIGPINGHNYKEILFSFKKALKNYFPVLIIFKTIIGFLSSDKSFSEKVHGSVFSKNEIINIYKNFTIKYVFKKKYYYDIKKKYLFCYIFKNYYKFLELIRLLNNIYIKFNLINLFLKFFSLSNNKSTRYISSIILKKIYEFNEIIGGSADLSSSNLTKPKNIYSITKKNFINRYINYGVREFGMCLINYGLSLNNMLFSFCSTFLVFSNYMYSGIRNSLISKLKNLFIFTHDSFFIGEDGPSHQPIEQLKILRSLPRFYVFRPFNLLEVIISWMISMKLKKNSSSLILSRQDYKNNHYNYISIKNILKGGYKLNENNLKIDLIIISSGSDLEIVFETIFYLKKYFNIVIISMYCTLLFNKQKKIYKKSFFSNKIIIFESSNDNLIKNNYNKIFIYNIKKYGKSASSKTLMNYFNFNKKILIKICIYLIKI
ncbi:hypothetical protein V7Z28_00065 [Candidatus Carsonella ruddii]|uniref:transketolase-like TK C-terminal-containing protein n=1 Tax=Carsonella ruddii TaxID=114186 RepID=UPI003D8195D0